MRQALLKALAKVDRPSEVFASGDLPLTLPGLVVEGVGLLRLPLGATQARKLIQRCRQAPYGWGAKPWLTRRCAACGKWILSKSALPIPNGSR